MASGDLTTDRNIATNYCYNVRTFKSDMAEDMVMVNPSLVSGTNVTTEQTPTTSHRLPVNVFLGDGTVLGQTKVNTDIGSLDALTLQKLVSNPLILGQKIDVIGSTTSANAVTQNAITLSKNTEQQTKKSKGGWPKGKKRKPEKISNAPKPPSNAYRLYTMDRRAELRKEYPNISFAEQVRKMGAEWSHSVDGDTKKKYLALAQADKQRYVEELRMYQESDTYQQYLAKKARPKNDDIGSTASLKVIEVYDPDILYCNLCDVYFNNNHNKTEHLMGSRHVKNMTKHFEESMRRERVEHEHEDKQTQEGLSDHKPLDTESFMLQFAERSHERDEELQHLRDRVQEAQKTHSQLTDEYLQHKKLSMAVQQDLADAKAQTSALRDSLHRLYQLPCMCGVSKPV